MGRFLVLLLLPFLVSCVTAPQTTLYRKKPAFYTYMFQDIHTGRMDMVHAEEVYATPASCQKTVTALLALKTLGPDYRYSTSVWVSKNKQSIQDVLLSFSGDPSLGSEDISILLKPLENTEVNGRIILDASIFKVSSYSENLMMDDLGKDYAQPVFAINIDKNLIEAGTDEDPNMQVSPKEIQPYILAKVAKILHDLNIKGNLSIIQDEKLLPLGLQLLNQIYSAPLQEILPPALKKSDNLIFDSLYLKMIHTQKPEGIDSWGAGSQVMKDLIKEHFAIDMESAVLTDGSGLSRYNRIQAKQLLAILRQGFEISDFIAALPTPGEKNTTLEKRVELPSHIRAKTGAMSGMSCLCGYSIHEKTPKVFVVMANSFAPPAKEMFSLIDKFVASNVTQ